MDLLLGKTLLWNAITGNIYEDCTSDLYHLSMIWDFIFMLLHVLSISVGLDILSF